MEAEAEKRAQLIAVVNIKLTRSLKQLGGLLDVEKGKSAALAAENLAAQQKIASLETEVERLRAERAPVAAPTCPDCKALAASLSTAVALPARVEGLQVAATTGGSGGGVGGTKDTAVHAALAGDPGSNTSGGGRVTPFTSRAPPVDEQTRQRPEQIKGFLMQQMSGQPPVIADPAAQQPLRAAPSSAVRHYRLRGPQAAAAPALQLPQKAETETEGTAPHNRGVLCLDQLEHNTEAWRQELGLKPGEGLAALLQVPTAGSEQDPTQPGSSTTLGHTTRLPGLDERQLQLGRESQLWPTGAPPLLSSTAAVTTRPAVLLPLPCLVEGQQGAPVLMRGLGTEVSLQPSPTREQLLAELQELYQMRGVVHKDFCVFPEGNSAWPDTRTTPSTTSGGSAGAADASPAGADVQRRQQVRAAPVSATALGSRSSGDLSVHLLAAAARAEATAKMSTAGGERNPTRPGSNATPPEAEAVRASSAAVAARADLSVGDVLKFLADAGIGNSNKPSVSECLYTDSANKVHWQAVWFRSSLESVTFLTLLRIPPEVYLANFSTKQAKVMAKGLRLAVRIASYVYTCSHGSQPIARMVVQLRGLLPQALQDCHGQRAPAFCIGSGSHGGRELLWGDVSGLDEVFTATVPGLQGTVQDEYGRTAFGLLGELLVAAGGSKGVTRALNEVQDALANQDSTWLSSLPNQPALQAAIRKLGMAVADADKCTAGVLRQATFVHVAL